MPSVSDPRVVIRLSVGDLAVVEAAAEAAGVATGALVRECAVRYAGVVAREVVEGRLKLRARGQRGMVEAALEAFGVEEPEKFVRAASSEVEKSEPGGSEVAALGLLVERPEVHTPELDPGVRRAIAFRRATGRL